MLLGVWEMVLIAIVALIVLGPEKMPEALRKLARALSQVRRTADEIKQNFDDMWDEPNHKLQVRPAPTTHQSAQRYACEEVTEEVDGPSEQKSEGEQALVPKDDAKGQP